MLALFLAKQLFYIAYIEDKWKDQIRKKEKHKYIATFTSYSNIYIYDKQLSFSNLKKKEKRKFQVI